MYPLRRALEEIAIDDRADSSFKKARRFPQRLDSSARRFARVAIEYFIDIVSISLRVR